MPTTTLMFSGLPMAHCFIARSRSALPAFRISRFAKNVPPSYGHHRSHGHRPHRRLMASVSGTVYRSPDETAPTIKLITKDGCTLCDKVKDVLSELREDYPHSLEQVDITDQDHSDWYSKYKYDIPVLHMEDKFWIKHRTTAEEATEGLIQAREGLFEERPGEPDAGAMERKQAERDQQNR